MVLDHQLYDFIYRRASYPIYLKFGVNKAELRILGQLCFYLRYRNRSIVSRQDFFHTVTRNAGENRKMLGCCCGLLSKGMLAEYEYQRKPGSVCYGITELGVSVLRHFDESLSELAEKFSEFKPESTSKEVYRRAS